MMYFLVPYLCLQIFHIRATTKTDMRELRVSSASLDVLGVEVTRRPGDQAVEQCQCPPGYSGAACQLCAPGHYRDYTAFTCLSCPCHGHEDTFQQDAIQASVVTKYSNYSNIHIVMTE